MLVQETHVFVFSVGVFSGERERTRLVLSQVVKEGARFGGFLVLPRQIAANLEA